MKVVWLALLALTLGGCASVSDIEQSHETMDVISGKTPKEYSACLAQRLEGSRAPLMIEEYKSGYRVIVPQKLSSKPDAVILVSDRSGGSAIKVHESMNNLPLRSHTVRNAATACISG
ncbi:hypothetical protein [Pseudomonas typographi]|uniref:Lipoprotein n=1 Tax=Pseudomonas typographi TaxID=2715964 RepID=A0ABR7Z0D9_9PSED|nr:hypothetical protein [Pseudomonas typographi]MBD1551357.1 hypothetical protein [Pseudomonas typographi]MBD1588761.1 hypothetical protein [Pseudomonas typographi]MBD1598877.1 hypothetical protein [Pseudomonas typographi]